MTSILFKLDSTAAADTLILNIGPLFFITFGAVYVAVAEVVILCIFLKVIL